MVRSPQSKLARLAERHGSRVRVIGTGDGDVYAKSPLWVEAGVFHLAEALLFETCEQLLALDSEVAVVRVGSDQAALYVRGELDCSEIMPAPAVDASTLEEDDSEVSFDGIDAPSLVDDLGVALADGAPAPVVQLVAQPSPVTVAQAGPVLISPDGATGPRCRIGVLWEAPLPSSRVDRLAWAGARDTVESIQVQTSQALRAYHVDQFGAQGGVLHLFPEREPTRAEQAVATLTLRLDAEGALVGTRLTLRRAHVPGRPGATGRATATGEAVRLGLQPGGPARAARRGHRGLAGDGLDRGLQPAKAGCGGLGPVGPAGTRRREHRADHRPGGRGVGRPRADRGHPRALPLS